MADRGPWPRVVVATVRAHGYVVQVRRGAGPHLLLEAGMSGRGRKRPQKYVADAKTADVAVGTARAKAFAAGLAAESSGSNRLLLHTLTYTELTVEVSRRGEDVPNLRTVQNRWQEVFALDDGEVVGPELREDLEERLVDFRDALFARGMDRKTVNSYVTRARKLAAIAGSMVRSEADGLAFGEALGQVLDTREMTSTAAAAAVGIKPSLMKRWVAGKDIPGKKNREVVPVLELLLRLPEHWLASRLPPRPPTRRSRPSRFGMLVEELALAKGRSLFGLAKAAGVHPDIFRGWVLRAVSPSPVMRRDVIPRLEEILNASPGQLAAALPPLLPTQLPFRAKFNPVQEREWAGLVVHKTDKNPRDRSLRPNEFWKVTNGKSSTEKLARSEVSSFLGYWGLAPDADDPRMRGLGRDPDEWGLKNLANEKHVTGFLDFLATRTGYTMRMRVFIKFVQSLLRPGTGYLWQANGFEWTCFPTEWLEPSLRTQPLTLEVWRSHCELVWENLGTWLEQLVDDELIELNRDYSHIDPILEMDHPMDALTVLGERLVAYVEARRGKVSDLAFAVDVRDLVLTLMMIRNPLRAHHWEIMTWTPDGTGHLIRTESGYELRFTREEFKALSGVHKKNKKNKKNKKDYVAKVAPDLTEWLDEYLLRWRPLLASSRTSDGVFVSSQSTLSKKEDVLQVSIIIIRVTKRYLGDLAYRGFAPHAMRHIIATHLVKVYQEEGIYRAAAALHNTPKMIRDHYQHLTVENVTHRSHELISHELAAGRTRLQGT